jgi:CheY-like chemotaxis protein
MADRKRVLVVDDEEMMRELVASMLESEGYVVSLASGGEEALAQIEAAPPDLVLLDLRMPGVSGWDVLTRLNAHSSPPPTVAMSGMASEEPPELRAVSRCVYGYLPKPFGAAELARTCALALSAALSAAQPARSGERRIDSRRSLLVPAMLLSREGTPAAVGQILSLSTGGAEFDMGAPLRPGTEVALSFEVPGGQGPFRVCGRVEWKKDGRLGLKFVDLSSDDRQRLTELLACPPLDDAP